MSGSLKGIDPALEWTGGEGDDYPRLFTLNYAKILGFEPTHDPDHDHEGETGAWGTNSLHAFGGPEVLPELDRLDLVQAGGWGGPKGAQLLRQAQFQPDLIPVNYQNRHK